PPRAPCGRSRGTADPRGSRWPRSCARPGPASAPSAPRGEARPPPGPTRSGLATRAARRRSPPWPCRLPPWSASSGGRAPGSGKFPLPRRCARARGPRWWRAWADCLGRQANRSNRGSREKGAPGVARGYGTAPGSPKERRRTIFCTDEKAPGPRGASSGEDFLEIGAQRVQDGLADAVAAREPDEARVGPGAPQSLVQALREGEGEHGIVGGVALEDGEPLAACEQREALVLTQHRAAEQHQPGEGALVPEREVTGQHRALGEAAQDEAVSVESAVSEQGVEEGAEPGAGSVHPRRVLVRERLESPRERCHLESGDVDGPPGATVVGAGLVALDVRGGLREDEQRPRRSSDGAGEGHQIRPGRAVPVEQHDAGGDALQLSAATEFIECR